MTYEFLQNYWWVLIALLGGLLVALMFVQGANLHLGNRALDDTRKRICPRNQRHPERIHGQQRQLSPLRGR